MKEEAWVGVAVSVSESEDMVMEVEQEPCGRGGGGIELDEEEVAIVSALMGILNGEMNTPCHNYDKTPSRIG